MAGIVSGGQKLTPNPNVNAPAGRGGDKWGANGGGIAPMGGSKPIAATMSDCETSGNYKPPAAPPQALDQQISAAALSAQTLDSSVAAGGSTQG